MEKKIVFVVREGLAVRSMDGQFTTFNGLGSVTAVLEGLKATLQSISTNAQGLAQDFVTIYVPDVMNGLLSNSIGLYLRNGKTSSGKVIGEAELNLYVEVYNMFAERNFNVRPYNLKYVAKDDAVTKALIKNTWAALDREERKIMMAGRAGLGATIPNVQTQQPSPEMVAMQQQMVMMQQMMQGFMTMMSGGQMPNMQQQAPVVPPVVPVTPDTNTTGVVTPDLGAPTSLNVDLSAGTEAANNTNTTTESSADNTSANTGIEEYEPEF